MRGVGLGLGGWVGGGGMGGRVVSFVELGSQTGRATLIVHMNVELSRK